MYLCIFVLFVSTALGKGSETTDSLIQKIEQHAVNKEKVLMLLNKAPQLEITRRFGGDFRETWRRTIIDGAFENIEKEDFLVRALRNFTDSQDKLYIALKSLLESHRQLFDSGQNSELMIRNAAVPAFKHFGTHMSLAQAIASISAGDEEQVQAFKTIFETGQNTRGYVYKLECHGEAVEFIYAVTDIVYGVMFPGDLNYGPNSVIAEPTKVQMFYIKAGDVIALHPYVLHSGSLSVEPDRSFSIIIYKKPVQAEDRVIGLPKAWQDWQQHIKLPDIDKYYFTLQELHIDELKDNLGFVAAKRPIRLPNWQ